MKTFLFYTLALFTLFSHAQEFRDYKVLQDKNGSIYLKRPEQFVLIHSEISIPIYTVPPKGLYKLTKNNSKWELIEVDKSTISSLSLNPTQYNLVYEDINGDGITDIKLVPIKGNNLIGYSFIQSSSGFSEVISSFPDATPQIAVDPSNELIASTVYKGNTQGQYTTNVRGSFIYNVPIKIPEGINQIQPNLSFQYDSSSLNGILGNGWRLSGNDYIARCPASLIRDGYISGINAGEKYKFCFNGQRLIEVKSNEFRLENEQFVKFTRNTANDSWTAYLPDGQKQSFGENNYSKLEDNEGESYKWFITSLSDQYSNTITYDYFFNANSVELKEIQYTQNSAGGSNHTIEFSYENRKDVGVIYMAGNQEVLSERLKSIQIKTNNNLVRNYQIEYYVDGGYYDNGNYSDPTHTSRIRSIAECFESPYDCANPIVFRLSNNQPNDVTISSNESYELEDDISSNRYGNGVLLPAPGYRPLRGHAIRGDFDGDNKQEAAWWTCSSGHCTHYAQMSSTSSPVIIASNVRRFYTHNHVTNTNAGVAGEGSTIGQVIDINGDGLDDYLITSLYKDHGYQVYISNGTTFDYSSSYSLSFEDLSTYGEVNYGGKSYKGRYSNFIELEDINGDGLIDILKTTNAKSRPYFPVDLFASGYNKIEVAINNGTGFDSFKTWGNLSSYPALTFADYTQSRNVNIPNLADLNGDGLKDVISFYPGGGVQVGINNGNAFIPDHTWASHWTSFPDLQGAVQNQFGQLFYECPTQVAQTVNTPIQFFDILGGDFLTAMQIEYGFSFATAIAKAGNREYRYESNLVRYGDFNGDGLSDVAYLREDGVYVTLSTGTSFGAPYLWTDKITLEQASCGFGAPRKAQQSWSIADVNADGKTDIILVENRVDGGSAGADDVNNYYILFSASDGSETHNLHFSEPVLAKSVPYNYESEGMELFPAMQITENGKLIFTDGNRLQAIQDVNPHDINAKEPLLEWKNYQGNLNRTFVRQIVSDNGSSVITIDYKNIVGNNDIYEQSGVTDDKTPTMVGDSSLYQFNSLYGGLVRNNKATVPYHSTQNVYVVSQIQEHFNKRLKRDKLFAYKNFTRHKLGYGALGFKEITETQRRGNKPDLSGRNLRIVSKYHQKAKDYYLLSGKLYSRETFATDTNDNEVDYEISSRLVAKELYDWRVSTFYDDHDPVLQNADYADYSDYYRDSPHYYHFVLREQSQLFELNTGKLKGTQLSYLKHEESEYVPKTQCRTFTLNSGHTLTLNLSSYFDDYGNPRETVEQNCDDFSITGKYTKNNGILNVDNGYNWLIGLVQNPEVEHWSYNTNPQALSEVIRKSQFTFNNKGKVEYEVIEPQGTDQEWRQNYYTYNQFGSVAEHTETIKDFEYDGLEFTTRTTKFNEVHNDDGLRKVTVTNALNQVSESHYDERFGVQVYDKSINDLVTSTKLDSYGRASEIKYPDNTVTSYDYINCDRCFSYNEEASWFQQEKKTGLAATRVYFDSMDRTVGERSRSFNGDFVYKYYVYNALDNLAKESNKFSSNSNLAESLYTYDLLERPTSITYPNGGVEKSFYGNFGEYYTYSNNLLVKVNSLGHKTYYEKDIADRDRVITDALGGSVRYRYDPLGNMSHVTVKGNSDSQIHSYSIEYDKLSRKIGLQDPNIGQVTYEYNALGLLASQVNSLNQVTRYSYDKLDRQIKRIDDATSSDNRTQSWIYDNKSNGIGLLGSLIGHDTTGSQFRKDYSYNSFGLPYTQNTFISGQSYQVKYLYNNFNRLSGYTFHDGYSMLYEFNNYGFKARVHDVYNDTLWQAIDGDALGNIIAYNYGNGDSISKVFDYKNGLIDTIESNRSGIYIQKHDYDFDTEGNLRKREDSVNFVSQRFCYDELDRLTESTLSSCSDVTNENYGNSNYGYDLLGNITKKDGISDYRYGKNAGPNAVTHANGTDYHYNSAGQMISGGGRTLRYTSFGKPYHITKNSYSTRIVYDADFNRIKRIDIDDNKVTTTTYIDKLSEIVTKESGITEVRHYLDDFAIRTYSSGSEKLVYLHRDHIGSIVAKTEDQLISNSQIRFQAHEPWGRRQENDWGGVIYNELSGGKLSQQTYATSRGFTDHEHLDGVGLIHMNGRVYDPLIGRFISPDPWIQDPKNSQSYNRYSYVWNNPLRYTDPTGEVVKIITTTAKIGYKLNKRRQKTGKLDRDNLVETLKEEGADAYQDLTTLLDPDASWVDKAQALIDLGTGLELNNKKIDTKKNRWVK